MANPAYELPPRIPGIRFDRIAGRGGMAVIWHGWHSELRRPVAVKVLDPGFSASGQDVRQFMAEVRTMQALNHPGLVRGYDADCIDGRYYMVMEYVEGDTLGSYLEGGSVVSQSDAVVLCQSVADAMHYAWTNFRLVHCDLKPENLMVDNEGTVKVLDLGLCQSTAAIRGPGNSDEILGSPAYISPEQVVGEERLDCRVDIYSLGATLYHLVTGHTLFPPDLTNDETIRAHLDPCQQAPDPRRYTPTLATGFVRLLAGMLVKDRAWRYPGWDAVSRAFSVFEQGGFIPPLPPEAVSTLAIEF